MLFTFELGQCDKQFSTAVEQMRIFKIIRI